MQHIVLKFMAIFFLRYSYKTEQQRTAPNLFTFSKTLPEKGVRGANAAPTPQARAFVVLLLIV